MRDIRFVEKLRICVVSDNPRFAAAVGYLCAPFEIVRELRPESFAGERIETADGPQVLEEVLDSCDCILGEWDLAKAPLISILGDRSRQAPPPLVVICEDNDHGAPCAALLGGADIVLNKSELSPGRLRSIVFAHFRTLQHATRSGHVDSGEYASADTPESPGKAIVHGPLRLDAKNHRFHIAGKEVHLAPRQFSLMDYLMRNPHRLITRDDLLAGSWGEDLEYEGNLVDTYISRMRTILKAHGVVDVIKTIHKKGYRFMPPIDG